MTISKDGYSGMDWVDALAARKKESTLENELREATEEQSCDNALQKTASILFDKNDQPKTPDEAMGRKAIEIQDRVVTARLGQIVAGIKAKLSVRGIDPVALGVVASKEEWDNLSDPDLAEKIAKEAAIKFAKVLSMSWQDRAMNPKALTNGFNPETSQDGKIISSYAANEETASQKSHVPVNANSIFDPDRLKRLFLEKTENEHDSMVKDIRDKDKARIAEKKASLEPDPKSVLEAKDVMNAGKVLGGGSANDTSAYSSRVPRNQVSILDNLGQNLSPEELKKRLAETFAERIPDTRAQIVEANEKRKAEIQGKKAEKDKSWDKLAKPMSTSDLAERLLTLWIPEKK